MPAHSIRRRVSITAVLALSVTLLVPATSYADPAPSPDPVSVDSKYDKAVTDAKTAEQAKAAEITGIEQQLAGLQIALQAAQVESQSKGEDYVAAQEALDVATRQAQQAATQLQDAQTARDGARKELGGLAAQMFKSNTGDQRLEALLSAQGLEEVIARSEAFDQAGSQVDRIVQRFKATSLIAESVKKRADETQAAMAQAQAAAKKALAAAQAAEASAKQAVTNTAATRTQLLTQLATLKQTTMQAEQSRQDAIDAERKRREEEAARREAERQRLEAERQRAERERLEAERRRQEQENSGSVRPVENPVKPKPPLSGGSSSTSAGMGSAAVDWALGQLGKPYLLGASGPDRFDCSGLTSQAWLAAGKWISRSSRSQYVTVAKIPYSSLRPGDLVFWARDTSDPSTIYHVAMYIGGGKIVEAARPGIPVRVTSMYYSGGAMPYAGRP